MGEGDVEGREVTAVAGPYLGAVAAAQWETAGQLLCLPHLGAYLPGTRGH